ncbi:MAG: serine hydrolase [Lachnospiraceae bacterium]|nr:serine hydrolase [Lachnospiraceae bacterium]
MKRIVSLCMILTLCFTAACGPKEAPSIATKPPKTSAAVTTAPTTQEETVLPTTEKETEEVSSTEKATEREVNANGRLMDDPYVDVNSEAFCVLNDSLQIVTGRNEFQPMAPASITKVLTGIVTLEHVGLQEVVEVSEKAVNDVDIISSGVYPSLKPGEKFTVEQLLYMLMIPSTNAAGNVLAEYVAGSKIGFVTMMNAKVLSLGLTHSHFMNPHGLDEREHYTCAFDMTILLREAVLNPDLQKILQAVQYKVPATEYTPEREMISTNQLLNGELSCPGVFASKTGSTLDAGATIVAACERDGMKLYCCTMKAESGLHYYDAANLLNASYAFLNGTSAKKYGYLHDMRVVSVSEDGVLVHAAAANDIVSARAVWWPVSVGTSGARFIEGIQPSKDMNVLYPIKDIGFYVIQLFAKDANGRETVLVKGVLNTGSDPEPGFRQWYEYYVYTDEEGFAPTGVIETKNGAYYMDNGKICYGFVGPYFFAGEDGRIVRGWFESGYTRYFAGADGRVVTGPRIIDGQLHHFNEYGAMED